MEDGRGLGALALCLRHLILWALRSDLGGSVLFGVCRGRLWHCRGASKGKFKLISLKIKENIMKFKYKRDYKEIIMTLNTVFYIEMNVFLRPFWPWTAREGPCKHLELHCARRAKGRKWWRAQWHDFGAASEVFDLRNLVSGVHYRQISRNLMKML